MSPASRDELLKRVFAPDGKANRQASANQNLRPGANWEELGPIIEGLIFGQRPIQEAAQTVTARHGLAAQGAYILSLISGGIAYPNELATVLRVSRSLITKELGRMTDAGLVEAHQDHSDKRRSELRLTANGHALCNEVRAAMAATLTDNLAHYSREELRLFAKMLRDARQIEAAIE